MQRYRECHDFYHALTGLPVIIEGELALKAFEFANTGLPMAGLSLVAYARLKPRERQRFQGGVPAVGVEEWVQGGGGAECFLGGGVGDGR